MSATEAPLKLEQSSKFNNDESKHALLSQQYKDNTKRKAKVPYCYGDDIESLLQTVMEFREACEELGFNKREDQFREFRKCLKLKAKVEWDKVKEKYITVHRGFKRAQQAWLRRFLFVDVFEIQKNYIEQIHKPFNMEVSEFAYRVEQLNILLREFPGAEDHSILSDHDLKNVFFRAMPASWQNNFYNTSRHLVDIELNDLIAYMKHQKAQADKSQKQGKRDNGANNNGGRGRNDGRGHQPGRGGNHFPKRPYQQPSGSNKRQNQGKGTHYCNIHGQNSPHSWIECFGNPDGPNYKPNFVPRGGNPSGRNQGRGRFPIQGRGRGSYSGFGRGRTPENYYSQNQYRQTPSSQPEATNSTMPVQQDQHQQANPPQYSPSENHWMDYMYQMDPRSFDRYHG
jgi:hypothetical protein